MLFSKSAPASDDAVAEESNDSPLTYSRALHQAGSGVAFLAKGTGGLGYLLGRTGFGLARTGVAKARTARAEFAERSAAAKLAAVDVAVPAGASTRKRLAIGGAAFAVVAAGAAFFSLSRRRKAAPPVAEAPPSLGPSANGSAPAAPVDQQAARTP